MEEFFDKDGNPVNDSASADESTNFLTDTFIALLDKKITLDAATPFESSSAAGVKPQRPSTPAPTLDPRAPPRPKNPPPTKTPEQIAAAIEKITVSNISDARLQFEEAFPETFLSTTGQKTNIKVLNDWLQNEIEVCKKKQTAISIERANEIYTLFLLSEIIANCTPFKVDLSREQLASFKLYFGKQITELRIDFGIGTAKPPPGVDQKQWRKSRMHELSRSLSAKVRALPEVKAQGRIQFQAAMKASAQRVLTCTQADYGSGFIRSPTTGDDKRIVAELKWHLESESGELAVHIIKRFKGEFTKHEKSKEPMSMAAQFALKNNDKLFDFLAKVFKETSGVLVKQKPSKHVKCLVKDTFAIIDEISNQIKNEKERSQYASQIKKLVLPFVFLNGYGGTMVSRLAANLPDNQRICATYIWHLLIGAINSTGNVTSKATADKNNATESVLKALASSSKEIVSHFDEMLKDIQKNDPDASA